MKRTLAIAVAALLLVTLAPLGQAAPARQSVIAEQRVPLKTPPPDKPGKTAPTLPSPAKPAVQIGAPSVVEAKTAGPVKSRILEPAHLQRWSTLPTAFQVQNPDEPHGASSQAGAMAPYPEAEIEGFVSNILIETTPGIAGNVSIAVDSNDTIYAAYQCYDSGEGGWDLCMARSYDNGMEWQTLVVWDDDLGFTGNQIQPDLVIDGSNTLWLAFRSTDPDNAFVYLTSPDGGASWTLHHIDTWIWYGRAWYPRFALSGNHVYMTFQYWDDVEYDIGYAYSSDGGAVWNSVWLLPSTVTCPSTAVERYPTVAITSYLGTTRVAIAYDYEYSATDHDICMQYEVAGADSWTQNDIARSMVEERYPDAIAKGAYLYVAYQYYYDPDYDVLLARSTNGGTSWAATGIYALATILNDTYPAITANATGSEVRVAAFYNNTDVATNRSTDYGATWSGTADLVVEPNNAVEQLRGTDLVHRPNSGASAGKHPAIVWIDNRNADGDGNVDVYYSTLDEAPSISFSAAWPANGTTIHVFAPRLDWNATGYYDADGDPLGGYWWKVWRSGDSEPARWTGGSILDTLSLPWFTSPGTTYLWKVAVDDGYAMTVYGSYWSFTVQALAGDNYEEKFDSTVTPPSGEWSGYTYASFESWEDVSFPPAGWSNSSPGWQRSSTTAYAGMYSAWSTYSAGNTSYALTSPPLDLRGSTCAYYNHFFRGSSESGYDFFFIEASATGAVPWRTFDQRSGNYWSSGLWYYFIEGAKDLSTLAGMVGSNTGRIRLRFTTDQDVISGQGWYVDMAEVFRDTEWHATTGGTDAFYRCSVAALGDIYTNGVSDEFYSPILSLGAGNHYLHLRMRGNAPSPDRARVWIRDMSVGSWTELGSLQGSYPSWSTYDYDLSAYANKTVVIAVWLDSTYSTLQNTGYWDLDQAWIDNSPTAVKLTSFAAAPSGPNILVTWETATEHDNVGFHLYRQGGPQDKPTRLNAKLIPSRAPGGDQGARYAFLDDTAQDGVAYLYTLEDVDSHGRATPHGPVAATAPYALFLPLLRR